MSDRKVWFDLKETVRIAEATVAAPEHSDSFSDKEDGTKTGPALMWVKDAGVYLMSNAIPRLGEGDVLYGHAYTHDGLLLNDDRDNDDIWPTARDICGGDDFAEYFELGELLPMLKAGLRDGLTHLVVDVADDSLQLSIVKA